MKRNIALLFCAALTGGWFWDSTPPVTNQTPIPAQTTTMASITMHAPSEWGNSSSGGTDAAAFLTKNYYVVFDGSGSMSDSECSGGDYHGRIAPARRAMVDFAHSLPADANLGLYVFDANSWSERVPLGHGPANRASYDRAINDTVAGNATPLGASLQIAYEALRKQSLKQNGYGEYYIVVVTDGGATDGDLMAKMVRKIAATPVVLETIGFCIPQGHALNQPGLTLYQGADNPVDLANGLAKVRAESENFK